MLQLHSLTQRYAEVTALSDVSLEVASGETVALIGPSGCGKSTLLRLIIALGTPDKGHILLHGESLGDVQGSRLSAWRRRIGYVIQEGGLFPHLNGHDNVALQARYFGWQHEAIEERIEILRRLVHLPADCLDRFPRQLSGGQRQRLGLMRALVMDPEVLLLDEPLGALDPMIRADLQRDLREIFRTLRKTVLLVTHDVSEARYLGDRLVLMAEGRIVQQGLYQELVEHPATPFVERFLAAQQPLLDEVDGTQPSSHPSEIKP